MRVIFILYTISNWIMYVRNSCNECVKYFIQWNHSRGEFTYNNINLVLIITCMLWFWPLKLLACLRCGRNFKKMIFAWCRQATRHYLSQYGPRFMSPYGVSRPHRLYVNRAKSGVITNIQSFHEINHPCFSLILMPTIHYLCYRHLFLLKWCQQKHICFGSNRQHCAINHRR